MIATDPSPTLEASRTIHLVGIGGPGMSPIAFVLLGMGHRVSGSDVRASEVLDRLRDAGAVVHVGHDPSHLPSPVDAVAISTAVPDDNVEVVAARAAGVPVVRRSALLPAICAGRRTVSVAGTHGKTTTSSMLTVLLRVAGLDPSFLIGGEVTQLGTSAQWGSGDIFVLEADESDGSGFAVEHSGALVTNVEPDHLEFHGSTDNLHRAFADFMAATDGPVVVCADDPVAVELGRSTDAITYGRADGADVRMIDLQMDRSGSSFVLERHGRGLGRVRVGMPGAHNATNACGAFAMALELGVAFDALTDALADFGGVGRRFEARGSIGGIDLVDDYAHLPAEVAAAVAAGAEGGWDRVVAVFQPHRYSRTEALGREFADAFARADVVVLTDVYPAGEAPRDGVDGRIVLEAVLDAHPRARVMYLPDRGGLASIVASILRPGDLCLTLGAGDITELPDELLTILEHRSAAR